MKTSLLSILVLLTFNLTACATSLKTQVFKDIHVGETKDEVVSKLGEPAAFRPARLDPTLDVLIYVKKADICEIALREEKVEKTACSPNPNYMSFGQAIGSVLQGAGKGMQDAGNSNHSTVCTGTVGKNTLINCD